MADRELTTQVTITSDTSGGKDAAQSLDQVANAAARNSGKIEEATTKTGLFGLKVGETKKLVRELGHEFPLAGMAVRAMLNPMVAAITLGIGFFAKMKESIAEVNKALDEAGQKAAETNFQDGINAKREAVEAFAKSAAAHAEAMAHLIDPEKEYQSLIERTIGLLHDRYAAQEAISNAQKGHDLQVINDAERTKQLSPEKATLARAEIEQRYRDIAAAAHTQEGNAALSLGGAQLHDARTKQDQLDKSLKPAEDRATGLAKSLAGRKALLEEAQKNAADIKKAYDEAMAKAEDVKRHDTINQQIKDGTASPGDALWADKYRLTHPFQTDADRQKIVDQAEEARRQYLQNKDVTNTYPERIKQGDAAATAAKAELDRLRTEQAANKTLIHDLEIKVADLQKKFELTQARDAAVNKIVGDTATRKAIGDVAGTEHGQVAVAGVGAAAEAAKAFQAGKTLLPEQQKVLLDMGAILKGHVTTLSEAAKLFASANTSGEAAHSLILAVITKFDALGKKNADALNIVLSILADHEAQLNTVMQRIANAKNTFAPP